MNNFYFNVRNGGESIYISNNTKTLWEVNYFPNISQLHKPAHLG